ncbi:MAG: hypothetical protein DCC43_12410 [Candidatus Brocadia sp.]|nr:hypothetical protein [Candidatus Brocadia fulgida]MCC6325262.1 DUF1858 domain-containing protein [Candidatus Brocadia sp.]MCE7912659.1 DUF1858 domain-containing protein [Candidatus Brocadia sp. AMX3]RIJ94173.1 MAG: hypothetical protein DCC43_12410 [Candidatus Brocadia sp.]UJS21131.1 MAG: DUF1858 domain-containing protein [Candidatus Brocadia sp.]
MEINRNTIIKDLIESHPETLAVFKKYNLVIAGGVRGPNEPIAFFAKAHEVNYDILVQELNEAIAKGGGEPIELPTLEEDKIYEKFVKTAIILTLTVGVTFGAVILSYIAVKFSFHSIYYAMIQAHGHAQLFGWVGLCIMGFALYIIPRVKNTELRHRNLTNICYGFIIAGLLLRVLLQPTPFRSLRILVFISAILEIISIYLFAFIILRTIFASKEKPGIFDKFFKAGIIWLIISTFINLGMTIYLYNHAIYEIPRTVFSPFVHLYLFGFVFMFIFAINIRTVFAFLDIKPVREKAVNLTFWVLNISVPIYFVAHVFAHRSVIAFRFSQGIAFPIAFALISFIYGLRIFERSTKELQDVVMDRSYAKTIRTAYLWLIVTAAILLVIPFLGLGSEMQQRFHGSLNHAVTVGFITMMIIGYASKMIPTFKGIDMHSLKLSNMTFILLNTGCFLRVFSQIMVGVSEKPVYYVVMGTSGWFELAALGIFGYNLWKTMNTTQVAKSPAAVKLTEIAKDTKVFDIVDQYPETLQIFLDFGFSQMANPVMRKTMGRVASIEMATKMHNVDTEKFLQALNDKIRSKK